MRAGARLERVDALRALALLPVLVVNLGSFHAPEAGPMLAPMPADSLLAWGLAWLGTALLVGKGITLLNFLVGYSLTLGRAPLLRARRLLTLGLLHGFLLYYGDILTAYALAALMALRHRRARLRGLVWRGVGWLGLGLTLMAAVVAWSAGVPADSGPGWFGSVALAEGMAAWWTANAGAYAVACVSLLLTLPAAYGLVLLGLAAGRLRLLAHRRWRRLWQACARWALPLLAMNLVLAWPMLTQRESFGLTQALAVVSLPAWVAWLLLRTELPQFLVLAGRNTLTVYLAGSLLLVTLLSGAGLHWPAGTGASFGLAFGAWLLFCGLGVAAARRGWRLPAEAWMARPR